MIKANVIKRDKAIRVIRESNDNNQTAWNNWHFVV